MAFRRFASLRGHPVNCWSDCGTNFVGAQQYLREVMRDWDIPKIQSVLSNEFSCTFKWEWNVPRASHQNGVVESLIKSVRQALAASSKNQSFTEEQWRTHLAEVTYLVNSRPFYPSSDGIWESPPVTPNKLLIGHHFPPSLHHSHYINLVSRISHLPVLSERERSGRTGRWETLGKRLQVYTFCVLFGRLKNTVMKILFTIQISTDFHKVLTLLV